MLSRENGYGVLSAVKHGPKLARRYSIRFPSEGETPSHSDFKNSTRSAFCAAVRLRAKSRS